MSWFTKSFVGIPSKETYLDLKNSSESFYSLLESWNTDKPFLVVRSKFGVNLNLMNNYTILKFNLDWSTKLKFLNLWSAKFEFEYLPGSIFKNLNANSNYTKIKPHVIKKFPILKQIWNDINPLGRIKSQTILYHWEVAKNNYWKHTHNHNSRQYIIYLYTK